MAILPKAIYRFSAILIKIPTQFFTDLEITFYPHTEKQYKQKKTRMVKTVMYNKLSSGGITIPDFNLYYRAVAMKTKWYCHRNRQVDQWKRESTFNKWYWFK